MEVAWGNEASSFSSISTQFKYDVFLSFNVVDNCNNFTSHLLDALERHGFYTFRDDTKLNREEYIGDVLLKAIEESRISLVVLSKNYVASRWCLDELVKIMECKKTLQQIVLPIFYNVERSDVRAQWGILAEAFVKHEERLKESSDGRVKKRREALIEVAKLSSWNLRKVANGDEAHLIRKVVEVVRNKLDLGHLHVASLEVGLESRIQKLKLLLQMESDDVRIVAVWGMEGIGKTTIVKKLYNLIRHKFEGSCFLASIRETWKQPNGLVVLQEQLLSDILRIGTHNLRNFQEGIEVVKWGAFRRKVLLILDDVDDVQQLMALGINRDSFGFGSRIIVTTRDISSLNLLKVDQIYEAEKFNEDESLELFRWHCFKEDHPTKDNFDLLGQVVHYAGGLPLALEILGSFFRGQSIPEWESVIAKLRKITDDEIQEKCSISCDSLSMEVAWANDASSSISTPFKYEEISTTATEGAPQSEHQVLPSPLESQQPSTKKMSTTAPEGQSQQQVPPTPLESQRPSTKKMSTIAIEGASQSQQQVPPTPLKSQQPSTMGSFLEIVEMSTTATEGAPQSQHQVLPTPLESEQPSTMKMSSIPTEGAPHSQQPVPPTPLESYQPSTMNMPTPATEGAPQSQQQVPPTPSESQHPSTMTMPTTAIEGASQSQQQVPPTPLDSQHPSTMRMSTTAPEGAPQSQQQVPPTPLEPQQPSTKKMSNIAIEGASQSQQQVPPTPLKSQQPSTMGSFLEIVEMPTCATEGAPQSQQQVPPAPLESLDPSTMTMPTPATEGASQSQQQVPPTPLVSQHPSPMKMSTTGTEGAPHMKDILLGKIKDYVVSSISRQFTYMFDFNNNIEKLETELEELQTTQDLVQRGVNEGRRPQLRVGGVDAVAWLARANEVTNQVKEIITDKAKVKEGCLNGFCPNIILRYSISRKAVKNTRVVVDLEAAGFDYVKSAYRMPQVENFRAFKSQRLNMEEISEQNFKALKSQMRYMEEIFKALKHDQIDLVGICGMAGVGKTTMAKEVAKRAKENKLFDEVVMAMVGQYPNLSEVQASIADMLGLKLGDLENPIATLLRQRLLQDNKKILVILEDIRAEFDLRTIGIPLGGANKNVRILYTSMVQDLWRDLQTKKEIPLELLSDDEAWQLFRDKAGDLADDQDLQPIAKQIVNECRGLPIALVLIGNILFKRSKGIFIKQMWEDVLKELTCSRSIPAEKHLSSSLELCYNYIEDEEAKHLFLLCCVFEEKKSIHIEDLVRYTWGLSLFPRVNTMRKVRRQVSALIDDLKRRYLLQDSENDKCVEVHDVVRDMGIDIASKDKGVLVCHGAASEWPKDTCEHYTYLSVISDRITELPERWTCPNLKFLLLECCKVEKLPSNFFEGMKKLKVLGLNNFDGILTLQSLRNLRTLSLKRFGGVLDNVSVMEGLVNLEILNFHGSSIKELPEEIGDLVNLRLLDLGDTWSLDKIPPGVISRLARLEELYIFDSKFREWEGEGKEGEGRNANLREFESLSNLNTLEIRIRCDVFIPEVPIFSELTTYKVLIGDTGGCCQHIDQYKTKLIVSASSPIPYNRGWFDLLLRSTDCLILEGEGCKDMVRDLLLRVGVDGLQQLKYLQISHCDTPECLANATNLVQLPNESALAVFPILEQLKLFALPNLREICCGPAPAGSLGELTDIYVDNCGRLGHLFQLPIVQSLTQLRSLSIMRCDMMEEVIWEEQREDVLVATNIIDFPKLETLVLDNLPSLVGFGREIKGIDFPHAKCLRLRHLRHLQCLFANNHGFLSLFPQKVTFPSLELLELQGLENLGDLWGSELLDFSFSKLKELDVEDCGSLRDLFHPSMTGGLENLQKLVVKNCQKMNAVVGRQEEIQEGEGRTIERTLFPQLIVLELDRLPNLRRFCFFTHPVESQLRRIYISDCPSMDTFSLGNVSAPNLSLPGISWNGDLNNTIKLLQEDKGQREMQFRKREQTGKTILPMDTFMQKRSSFLGSTSKNAAHELNIITNSSFAHDTKGWFSVHKCSLSVHTTSQLPDHVPMPRDSEGKIRYILATERRESREGPAQWITDKLQLFVTYKVSAWIRIGSGVNEPQIATIAFIIDNKDYFDAVQAEVNGDEWHEIVGSFRIESEPDQVMVYVHGFDSGVDLRLAGLQISPVDRRASFEELKKKTDEVRKRDVILQFSGSGSSRPGTFVNVEQKQNSFPIGSCIDRGDLSNKDLVNFFVENFNWAVFQYQLTWDWTESEQGRFYYRGADDLLAFCLDHNIKMRGPCILENRDIPPWVRELEGHDLEKAILKRLNDILTRYKWMFQHYDVSNEMLHETYFRDKLGNDICVTMFKTAKQLDPKTKLFVNDYHVEEGCDARSSPEKYIEHILDLKARGAPVEGVGMQGHVRFPVGEIICSALDKMGKLGLPIWFTEIDVESVDEHVRAEDLEVMLREAFAHPAVEGIMLWGFWEGMYRKNAHLVNKRGDLNAAGRKFLELKKEWMSNGSGSIDNQGQFMFRGFQGSYEVEIGPRKFTFDVPENPKGQSQSPHVVHINL